MKVERRNNLNLEKWNQLFASCFGDDPGLERSFFANSSVLLNPGYHQQMARLCTVLNKACKAIVLNYFNDERIQKHYQLDNGMESLLKKTYNKTYNQGFYRPDFLYDKKEQPKICEIGARYALNGWMISYYLRKIGVKSDGVADEGNSANPNLTTLIEDLHTELAHSKRIALVHDDEKGTEIFYLQTELEEHGFDFFSVKPQDLQLIDDCICVDGNPILHLFLEMDREELKKIRPEVMDKIIESHSYFNDIRTLILIHDKRVLSVMYDEKIMRDYLSDDEYGFMKEYLIPSFVITDPKECDPFIYGNQNLILKLNSGGRGIGAYIKKDCTPQQWEEIIRTNWDKYVIQHYVDQKEFEDVENNRHIHLVGMLLCKDDKNYGPGLFRGSDESVVNVHQGRALIYPILEQ